jgi:hypothetical protein
MVWLLAGLMRGEMMHGLVLLGLFGDCGGGFELGSEE